MTYWYPKVQTIYHLNIFSVVSNPDVEMEVSHEEEKVKDAPLVSELSWYHVSLFTSLCVECVLLLLYDKYFVVYVGHILYDLRSATSQFSLVSINLVLRIIQVLIILISIYHTSE